MDTLKILAIGNSFSEDSMMHLYGIARDAGVKNIILGNLYIGGCELARHWDNARNNIPDYTYFKNTTGTWTSDPGQTLLHGLQDENWDYISLQQVSGLSGISSTYNSDLTSLITCVTQNKTNPGAKLVWNMTWAYQQNSTHGDFPRYGSDQTAMYSSIVSSVQTHILPDKAFSLIIPAGTAIQNVRTSFIGDTLTRDGYHLSLNLGRYIAALTWYKALSGESLENITYVPDKYEVPDESLPLLKRAVNAAMNAPFTVTRMS